MNDSFYYEITGNPLFLNKRKKAGLYELTSSS